MEIWKYGYAPYKEASESGDVIEVSTVHNDAIQGYYVPTFVIKGDPERGIEPMAPDLKSVKDLAKYWELFKDPEGKNKGRIYSSPVGWLADEITQAKVKNYGLDKTFNVFNPGSQSALEISLSKACEQGKPWVGYYWEPTWIAGKYDLTLLEDEPYREEVYKEGKCAYPNEDVIIVAHKSFPQKAPEIYEFLKKFKLSGALVSKTLAYMQENKASSDETAVKFLRENEDMWTMGSTRSC
jgi:glycine betaine/proline transport system substrate-binding protein